MERQRLYKGGRTWKKEAGYKEKFLRQSIICLCIFSVVFVIGCFNTDTAVSITKKIKSSVSYTVDYENTVKTIMSKVDDFTKGIKNNDTKNSEKNN